MSDLFGYGADDSHAGARRTDPATSHESARLHPAIRRLDRWKVLQAHALNSERGLDDYDLAFKVGRQQNSAGKRRGELMKDGLIAKTNERRRAPSGASCIVWRITGAGMAVYLERMRAGT